MSLRPELIEPVPEETARVARAAFPRGNPCLQLRDVLGSVYTDQDFANLFPRRRQAAEAPWRLALVTVLQFAEGLCARKLAAAEPVGCSALALLRHGQHDRGGVEVKLLGLLQQLDAHPLRRRAAVGSGEAASMGGDPPSLNAAESACSSVRLAPRPWACSATSAPSRLRAWASAWSTSRRSVGDGGTFHCSRNVLAAPAISSASRS